MRLIKNAPNYLKTDLPRTCETANAFEFNIMICNYYLLFKTFKRMKKFYILQRPALLVRGRIEKTIRILRLTFLILMMAVFNVFGVTPDSGFRNRNLNLDKETGQAAVMQQNRVTGTIIDENGNPMPGVNIQIEGTTQGSISDVNGKYTLDSPKSECYPYFHIYWV